MSDEFRDATPDGATEPSGFDLASWIAGFQPTRKACILYGRTDLMATIDRLNEEANLPGIPEGRKREILAEAKRALATLKESSAEFVVQTMDVHRQMQLLEELGYKKGETVTHEMECAFIAAHVIEPEGVTGKDIETLYAASSQQVEKLSKCIRKVDTVEPTITAPFSSAS